MNYKILISAITFVTAISLGSYSWAASPTVNSISGSVIHSQSISIEGENFGPKKQAGPEIWDTVDNVSAYDVLSDGDKIPPDNAGPWNAAKDSIKFTTARPQRHQFSQAQYYGEQSGSVSQYEVVNGRNLFISWWWRPNIDFQPGDGANKMIRTGEEFFNPSLRLSWRKNQSNIYDDNAGYLSNIWHSWGGDIGQWNRHTVYFDNENRKAYFYTNNTLVAEHDYSDDSVSADIDAVNLVGLDPNRSISGLEFDMDDIYVDSTQSRVEICNSSNYSNATHCEIQIPETWTDSSVQINVNQGSFDNGSEAYLFVVDSNGNVSSGYPVKFGSESASTELPAPTNIKVEAN